MDIHVELAAETLFHIGPIAVTNSMITMFIVMGLILLVFSTIARKATMVPGRAQGGMESIAEFLLNLVEGTAGRKAARTIFPLITGIFIFILFANYSGLFPGIGTIGKWEQEKPAVTSESSTTTSGTATDEEHKRVLVPFLRSPNADLNMTLAMALVTFTVVQIAGIRAHGVRGRIKHMANPWWIFPLEAIQEFARIISLSFRLFGNIFAGEVLLFMMSFLVPFVLVDVFYGLELFVGLIQAFVFAMLTLVFGVMAVSGHVDHTEQHGAEHATTHA